MTGSITCSACGTDAPRTGNVQKYCRPCSERADLARKAKWAKSNPPSSEYMRRRSARKQAALIKAGIDISTRDAEPIFWGAGEAPELAWEVRVAIPFTYRMSKNSIWAMTKRGHVFLRDEHRAARSALSMAIKVAIQRANAKVAHNKLWIDILVQKPDHKGDAVNVIDAVCDALKQVVGLDDRWFSIRKLDWQIVKSGGRLMVGIGQESAEDVQICSYCGRMMPLAKFYASKRHAIGVGRECRECVSAIRTNKAHGSASPKTIVQIHEIEPATAMDEMLEAAAVCDHGVLASKCPECL